MLYCTFRRIGLLSFCIYFFEIRLIPTLFLILGWGYQPDRVQAGIYLLNTETITTNKSQICFVNGAYFFGFPLQNKERLQYKNLSLKCCLIK